MATAGTSGSDLHGLGGWKRASLLPLWVAAGAVASGGDSTGPSLMQRLCDALSGLKLLRLLSLVHCQLGPDAADALSGLLLEKR